MIRCYQLTLRLKVGEGGVIILPKDVRERAGIREGDSIIVELGDGITLRPERRIDLERLRIAFKEHDERLRRLNTKEPEPGELSNVHLEEEFEECGPL
jgi:AbrB family looped-hinge helix DNA binding protein